MELFSGPRLLQLNLIFSVCDFVDWFSFGCEKFSSCLSPALSVCVEFVLSGCSVLGSNPPDRHKFTCWLRFNQNGFTKTSRSLFLRIECEGQGFSLQVNPSVFAAEASGPTGLIQDQLSFSFYTTLDSLPHTLQQQFNFKPNLFKKPFLFPRMQRCKHFLSRWLKMRLNEG